MDKLFKGSGLGGSASLSSMLTVMKGATASETKTDISSSNPNAQQEVAARNDKLASKLLNNLGKLQDMSSTIQKRMQNHDDEIREKQKREQQIKQEKALAMEAKLNQIQQEREKTKNEYEMSQNAMKEKEESHGKTKEELDKLVLDKNQSINDLKMQSKLAIENKNATVKDLQDQIAKVRDMIKEIRLQRKGLDDLVFNMQEASLKKKLKLKEVAAAAADKDKTKADKKAEQDKLKAELQKEQEILDELKDDIKRQQQLNDDLKKKLAELLAIRDKLREEAYLLPHGLDQVKAKLDALKNEIAQLQDQLDDLVKTTDQKKQILQVEQKKHDDLKNMKEKNLLTQQVEKQGRENLMALQDLNQRLQRLLTNCQVSERILEQLIEQGGMKDEKLERQYEELRITIQGALGRQGEIQAELAVIEDKLLHNQNLPLDALKASNEKMKQINQRIGTLNGETVGYEKQYADREIEYKDFVKRVIDFYLNKIKMQTGDNKQLIDKITGLQDEFGGKVGGFDGRLNGIELTDENMVDPMVNIKVKISQFLAKNKQVSNFVNFENHKLGRFKLQEGKLTPDYILNYVQLGIELERQAERLKKALDGDLKDMARLVGEIGDDLKALEKLADDNKKKGARGKLADMIKLSDDIDKKIDELQNRMDAVQAELDKLDPNEHSSLKDALQKDLDQLQRELNDCKDKNKKLKSEVEKLNKLPDDELAKQMDKIDALADDFKSLDQHELPPIEKGLDDLEKKLKNAINKKKNNVKQDALDNINGNKIKVKQLSDILDKLEKEIARIDNEGETLERTYRYKDLERDHDLEDKIKNEIADQKEKLKELKGAKDQLLKNIADLEDRISGDIAKGLPQDEQLKNWAQHLQESEDISKAIDDELDKAKVQQTKLDGTAGALNELNDKYKQKDKLYRTCIESQKKKQAKVDGIKRNAQVMAKKMANVEETLNNLQTPDVVGSDLGDSLQDKKDRLGKCQDKLQKIFDKADEIQARIDEICAPLKTMGDQEVLSPDLQKIIEELNKLDVLLQELRDDLNDLQKELDELLEDIKKLQDKMKNLQLDEAERAWNALLQKLRDTDKKYGEVEGKLSKYVQKIKEGMRAFSDDDEILDELKKLKDESDDIDKHLRQVDGKRNNLSSKERQAKDLLNKYKQRTTPPTNEEIQQLVDKFRSMGKDSDNIYDELQAMSDDLDRRLDFLDGLMKRAGELQDLFKKYGKLIGDANKGLRNLQKDLDEATDLAHMLREVLDEMYKGLSRDYINRGEFIINKLNELADQDAIIKQVADAKEMLTDMLDSLKQQKITNIVNCELQDLLDQIPRYEEITEKLADNTNEIKEVIENLKQMRKEIDVADVPKNIRDREQNFDQFSRKLRQYEQDLSDIKKLCMYNPLYDALRDVKLIEQNIQTFTEQKVRYQRVLKQDLIQYEQQPAKLEPLPVLKEVIQKVRELGDKLLNSIDQLSDCLLEANKLKKQIGGQDQQNKWKALEMKEDDLRRRLNELKKRFRVIHKGGEDCDGYTSNPEETTFIDTLLQDKPDVNAKQVELLQIIDDIQAKMFEIRGDLEDQENQDFMQQSKELGQKLSEIEDNILASDKDLTFLEKLADSFDEKFIGMNAPKKLDKRQTEISEIAQVATHFKERVGQTQLQVADDLKIIEKQSKYLEKMGINPSEDKNKEDLVEVQAELNDYLRAIEEIFADIDDLEMNRQGVQVFYNEKVVKESPYKKKQHNKEEHYHLLDLNSQVKKRILDLIKMLKDIQNAIRDVKRRYQQLKANYAGLLSRKMYSAMKGDLVDEQVGEYINKLTFDVPIKKTGNNQYTIGNRKIIASLINEKLMVRVGGGYVGMDEFMMVYGSAELLRIQKEEKQNAPQDFDFIRSELLANYFIGDFLGEDTLDVEPTQVELMQLKSKIRNDYNTRKGRLYRNHEIGERPSSEGRKPVVGILDARNALKKNVHTIITGDGQASQTSGKGSSRLGFGSSAQTSRNTVNKLGERNNPSAKGSQGTSGFTSAVVTNQKRMSVAQKSTVNKQQVRSSQDISTPTARRFTQQ